MILTLRLEQEIDHKPYCVEARFKTEDLDKGFGQAVLWRAFKTLMRDMENYEQQAPAT